MIDRRRKEREAVVDPAAPQMKAGPVHRFAQMRYK
jgi:hypothetical protein